MMWLSKINSEYLINNGAKGSEQWVFSSEHSKVRTKRDAQRLSP